MLLISRSAFTPIPPVRDDLRVSFAPRLNRALPSPFSGTSASLGRVTPPHLRSNSVPLLFTPLFLHRFFPAENMVLLLGSAIAISSPLLLVPQLGSRSCLGFLRLASSYSRDPAGPSFASDNLFTRSLTFSWQLFCPIGFFCPLRFLRNFQQASPPPFSWIPFPVIFSCSDRVPYHRFSPRSGIRDASPSVPLFPQRKVRSTLWSRRDFLAPHFFLLSFSGCQFFFSFSLSSEFPRCRLWQAWRLPRLLWADIFSSVSVFFRLSY